MNGLYDTAEPNVIDDVMLRGAVEEQGPKEEAGRIAKAEGIAFKEVTNLRLDFRRAAFGFLHYAKCSARPQIGAAQV